MPVPGRGASPPPEDLTARARIRDAALLQFAERGVRGATFRSIAEAAGVSVGLVQHHYGTKEELRAACDAYALDVVRELSDGVGDRLADPGAVAAALEVDLPVRRYFARALVDDSAAAERLFDDLVELTERYLDSPRPGRARPATRDLHAYAAAMAAMSISTLVLRDHLSRALGADTLSAKGAPRLRRAVLEVFADQLLSPELVAQGHAALDEYERSMQAADQSAAEDDR
ncbi:TetR/AcrR family transcriptional regulator [Actinomadura roseirufa]|uniref:TetR/AcrR family transcriptional regulator n=1 Tax=Actinomadura roseirufa TaxID=2094049 RepID=UPI0010413FB3|nr:TetR/AcrR family transcriptional regulator [Actinomadura roseirufa]